MPHAITETASAVGPPRLTLLQRLQLALVSAIVPALVRLIGCTLRFEYGFEQGAIQSFDEICPGIYPFWHGCVIPAMWFFRNQRLAVMTSQSLDGEYIARVIHRLGFVAIRGSSSRGGQRALLEMQTFVQNGGGAAFTIDGPRGPRRIAKRGPILLAKATGARITPFYVEPERRWVFNSWDRFMIPKPFSRAFLVVGKGISVPPDADERKLDQCYDEMQASLERITAWAESFYPRR